MDTHPTHFVPEDESSIETLETVPTSQSTQEQNEDQ
jgi:hypothetical protein